MSDDQQPPTFPVPPPPSPAGHSLAGLEPMPRVGVEPYHDRFRPQLEIDGPEAQRRWTVALRLLLAVPVVLVAFVVLWGVILVTIMSWFCALVLARVPNWAAGFFIGYLAFVTRVSAYVLLLTDRYPGLSFKPVGAVRTDVRAERLHRGAVLFRWPAAIPAAWMLQFLQLGWMVLALPIWLIVLIRGRMPAAIFEATVAVQRVQLRYGAYMMMVTDAYPLVRVFGDQDAPSPAVPVGRIWTRPLALSRGARVLLSFVIGLGVLGYVGEIAAAAVLDRQSSYLGSARDTYSARNILNQEFGDTAQQIDECSGRLDCLQQGFERIAREADEFAERIDAIRYPEVLQSDADVLETEARNLGITARRIANAPVGRYNEVLRGSHVVDQMTSVFDDATTLAQRLY